MPLSLFPAYEVEPYQEAGMGNTPPTLKFSPDGPAMSGPPRGIAQTLNTTVAEPATLTFWAGDDGHVEPGRGRGGPPVTSRWSSTEGRGPSRSGRAFHRVEKKDGGVSTRPRSSARQGITSCGSRPTTRRERAAADSSAAGPTPT